MIRHRIGDQMPAVSYAGPDPNAIALCQDLMAEPPVDCAILFGSRALGGWDDQSDLDIIVIHQAAGDHVAKLMKQQSVRGLRPRRHTSTDHPSPPPRVGNGCSHTRSW